MMTRRIFVHMRILQLLFIGILLLDPSAVFADGRPNIVLIISDDQDNEHFGFVGSDIAHTPSLDKLASAGTVFENCYLTSSRCRPSLATLLSGRRPHNNGIFANFSHPEDLDPTGSLPNLLKDAGYVTYGSGKYWEGDLKAMGFTHGFGDFTGGKLGDFKEFVREDGQAELFSFVDEHAGKQPMFIWWAPLMPHTPHKPPQRFRDLFDPEKIPVPEYIRAKDREEFLKKEHLSLAMEAWMDDEIGKFREKMVAAGEDENTLYVFVTDNGWCNGLPAKGSAFDKGFRTPAFFTWPGRIPAGVQRDDFISSLDLFPTLLSYADIEIPDHAAGINLRRHLEEQTPVGREKMMGAAYPRGGGGQPPEQRIYALYLRTAQWRYIYYVRAVEGDDERDNERVDPSFRLYHILAEPPLRDQGDQDLYDLDADPYELNDLAAHPEHRERLDWLPQGGA